MSAGGEPVDAPDNGLVALGMALEVGIIGVKWGDEINRDATMVRSHVGDGVELVNGKEMCGVLNKSRLGEEDREFTIRMAFLVEGGSEKVVDNAHEVNFHS